MTSSVPHHAAFVANTSLVCACRRLHAYIDHPSVKRPNNKTAFCDALDRSPAPGEKKNQKKKKKQKKRGAAGGKKKKNKNKKQRKG